MDESVSTHPFVATYTYRKRDGKYSKAITRYPGYLIPKYLVPLNLQNILAAMAENDKYYCDDPEKSKLLIDLGLVETGYAVHKSECLILTKSGIMMANEIVKARRRLDRKSDLTLTFDEFISSLHLSIKEDNYGKM